MHIVYGTCNGMSGLPGLSNKLASTSENLHSAMADHTLALTVMKACWQAKKERMSSLDGEK